MKRVLTFAIALFLIFNIAGCASIQKKFTRKKKEAVKMPRIYQVKKYERKPTPELYKKHYVYWESFQSEMIMVLGQNNKKNMVCIEHILSNLRDMQNMLLPEKAAELEVHIVRLAKIKDILVKEDLTTFNRNYIMMTLERESRYIKRIFIYSKVKDSIRTSYEDEPNITADLPKPQEVANGQSQPKAE
ncbi:MAG: hypothetical protein NTZ95_02705 [Candidatus Omnitrophica bacterium]|nr:hypothetical protein [Candidatus Omnitrophota bacterium]